MAEEYADRYRAGLADLEEFLTRVGAALEIPVNAYLIGGGNMAIRDLKPATKDIDAIVETRAERLALEQVMLGMGYTQRPTDPFTEMLPKEYEGFRGDLYRKDRSVGLDVFERIVVDKLTLTEGMKARADGVEIYGNLTLHLLSNEDICLFKAITYRPDDDGDVLQLIGEGLDVGLMRQALREQPPRNGVPWPEHVAEQLRGIAKRTGVEIPWASNLI